MNTTFRELFRIDPLTGCNNFLSFIETLADSSWLDPHNETGILFLDMNHVKFLNEARGHVYTDSVIRWMGILLREESNTTVYRAGGVEFAIIIASKTREEHIRIMDRILERARNEARPLGIPEPPVDLVLIRYRAHSTASPESILMQMNEAMVIVKNNGRQHNGRVFAAEDLRVPPFSSSRWKPADDSDKSFTARWISHRAVKNVLLTAQLLDEVQQAAYTDTISGLPNMRAAMLNVEQIQQDSVSTGRPFSILLIDGDNIRAYNNVSYAVGDEMIRDLGALLKDNLRPGDFVARWRSGDEFIVILPQTTSEGAKVVAERFCTVVRETSQSWRFPTSISIGIATCPVHGDQINLLVDKAEGALKRSKDEGKDRASLPN